MSEIRTVETIEISVLRGSGAGDRLHVTASIAEKQLTIYGPAMIQAVGDRIVDKIVETWMADHDAQILEALAPGEIAEGVRKAIAARVFDLLKLPAADGRR